MTTSELLPTGGEVSPDQPSTSSAEARPASRSVKPAYDKGTGDERWGWPWMADVVRAVRPRYVVMENVSALLADPRAFGWILADLADCGFDAEWEVLRASDLGAPHRRERLFVVAYPPGDDGADQDEPATARSHQLEPRGSRWESRRTGWLPEPAVDRVAHGVPRRLVHDPLHALGNAVVPAVAEFVGRMIMAHAEAVAV